MQLPALLGRQGPSFWPLVRHAKDSLDLDQPVQSHQLFPQSLDLLHQDETVQDDFVLQTLEEVDQQKTQCGGNGFGI